MQGSAVFRTGVAPGGALAGPWVRNPLWAAARAVPSLDLRFAENKSLIDATTGQNLVTFTRASSGTYVDSQGVIRTATTNLLLRSEEFETTWISTAGAVSANTSASPIGTVTADKYITNSGSTLANEYIYQVVNKPAVSATYAASVYVKQAGFNRVALLVADNASTANRASVTISLANGAVVAAAASFGTFSAASASVTSLADGWYRLSLVFATGTETALRYRIYSLDSSVATGNGTDGLFVWGAQLEQSSTVGEYVKTTSTINSAPRFDHDPTTGESLGLLVEESRTNLAINSALTGGTTPTSWTLAGTPDTPTVVASILGNADGATALSFTSNSSRGYIQQLVALAANTTYTFSVYVENAAGYASTSANIISLNNGPTGSTITGATGNPVSGQRIICSISVGATAGNVQLRIGLGVGSNATGTIVLSRPQLEAGAFPTSYIPTAASAATRAADVASISGSNFSSWYRQDEGTVFVNTTLLNLPTVAGTNIVAASDGTNNNRVQLGASTAASGNINFVVTAGGVFQANPLRGSIAALGPHRAAGSYRTDSVQIGVNGLLGTEDTSATIPTNLTGLNIANSGNPNAPGSILLNRLTFWPQRLGNEVLQRITQ